MDARWWIAVRVLVVADYPPPYGPVVDATVAEVRTLRALGHEVEVCSPAPSAAHHHRDLRSVRGLASLVTLARRFDRVLVRLQEGTPADHRLLRALRAVPNCEVVAYGLSPEHGLGRALADARSLVIEHRLLGSSAGSARGSDVAAEREVWPAADLDAVMQTIRVNAAHRRGTGDPSVASERRTAPVRRIAPLALPAPVSLRPGASVLKRLVRRLTAWQIDPIVGQVNRLREALIATLEQGDELR
ncbi:MAG: hypothetical protein ABIP21_07090 [Acidimicrobiia bacterium]